MQKIKPALLGVLLLGILGASFASVGTKQSEAPTVQDSCPAAHETARAVMEEFLTDSSWVWLGLTLRMARHSVGSTRAVSIVSYARSRSITSIPSTTVPNDV